MRTIISWVVILVVAPSLCADVLVLNDRKIIKGSIIERDAKRVLVKFDQGTVAYPNQAIMGFYAELEWTNSTAAIPSWGRILDELSQRTWASDLKQVPPIASLNGTLASLSFQCAHGYEVSIYGDVEQPAGIEISVRRHLMGNNSATSNCLELLAAVLQGSNYGKAVLSLNRTNDVAHVNGLTLETTTVGPRLPDLLAWRVAAFDKQAMEASGKFSLSELYKEFEKVKELERLEASRPKQKPPEWKPQPIRWYVPTAPYSRVGKPGRF